AARDTWRSFKPDGRTGAGSLFYLARAEGWSDKGERTARTMPKKAPGRPAEPRKAPRPGMDAAKVWQRMEAAAVAHPYIDAKQGTADGLRAVPAGDRLRIAGQSVAGWLVVPVVPLAGGEPTSVQFIPPPGAGRKLNLPGAPVAGVFIVGDMLAGGTVYLCEGIGQAWACWKATGAAAVVAFGWGRVRAVAAELRQRDASARLVLVPDVGKEQDAEAIAREVGALYVTMPEGWPVNADVNDLAQRDGDDVLEVLLSNAREPSKPEPRFKLLGSADLHALPPLAWRVRGVLPALGLGSVYGPSASGKSFLALDMAAAIAEGREWFGYRVNAAPVVYCALEGEAGFRLRVEAWEQANRRMLPDGLRLVLQPFKLTEPQDVADMAAAVCGAGNGAVTILDTLNRAAPEADENASADMGRILEAAKELQRRTGGLVVAVHHSGKDATKGLRGHSSLFAALDAAVEVTRDGDRRQWKVAKAKDGADGEAHPFKLRVVEVALDSDGEPVTSCVVCRDDSAAEVKRAKLPQGGNQLLVYEGIRDLFKGGLTGKPGAPPLRPCIALEVAVMTGGARLTCATDKRTSRARDAITGLVARGVLGLNEGWLWTA
ncbi:MAG: AAA family ATPase, partial [Burkholderiaceae bacterium]|nr:AAA family ATPase [Burkholderiaceae bacterium]